MPKLADEDCREEGAGWKLLEHLQEQLGGKQVVDVQLQFWCRHLFPSARLDLLHSASPHILNIDPTTNLHSQPEPQLETGLSSASTVRLLAEEKTKKAIEIQPKKYVTWAEKILKYGSTVVIKKMGENIS